MDAQLSTARAKLEDWVTCPSAKTPGGKAEIEKATSKLETIKTQIKKADEAIVQTVKTDTAQAKAEVAKDGANNVSATLKVTDDGLTDLARRSKAAAPVFGYTPSLGGNLSVQA